MEVRNIKVTAAFIKEVVCIPKQREVGSQTSKISNRLLDFVRTNLNTVNPQLYASIADKFTYSSLGTIDGWRGNGPKTIERLLKDHTCSQKLFKVIWTYLSYTNVKGLEKQEFYLCKKKMNKMSENEPLKVPEDSKETEKKSNPIDSKIIIEGVKSKKALTINIETNRDDTIRTKDLDSDDKTTIHIKKT
jgi:hypothetical protein